MPPISPPTEYRLTDHARFEMERRGISVAEIARVLSAPEQSDLVRPGRVVYQSRIGSDEPGQIYLLRVFVGYRSAACGGRYGLPYEQGWEVLEE